MKRLLPVLAAVTAMLVWQPLDSLAQQRGGGGRGNFDPAEMREQMMERYKETLEVTSEDEWKVIEGRIQKVTEARREVTRGAGRGMFAFGGRRGGGGGSADAQAQGGQTERRRGGGFGGPPSPAAQELQRAIESKASAETIKTKLAAYREERKQKEAALEKAQQDLKQVLSVRQEAAAVMAGLLD